MQHDVDAVDGVVDPVRPVADPAAADHLDHQLVGVEAVRHRGHVGGRGPDDLDRLVLGRLAVRPQDVQLVQGQRLVTQRTGLVALGRRQGVPGDHAYRRRAA